MLDDNYIYILFPVLKVMLHYTFMDHDKPEPKIVRSLIGFADLTCCYRQP